MSRLDEFASSIPQTVADLENSFSSLQDQVTALNLKGKAVHDRWKAFLDAQQQSVAAAEAAINKLSNALPASAMPVSPITSQAANPTTALNSPADQATNRMLNVMRGHGGTVP